MTDQWTTDDDDSGQQNSGGGLRKQLEQALAELKTLKEANGTLKEQARRTSVSTVLKDKGYNIKVAKLIPTDVEPTAEAVQKWLDEYGDVFNVQQEAATDSGTTDDAGGDVGASDVDPEEAMSYIQTMRQMGNVNGGMLAPEKSRDLLAKINDPELKHEDLIKLIEAHGGGVGLG